MVDGRQADVNPAQGCLMGQGDKKCPEGMPPVWAPQPSSSSAAPSMIYHGRQPSRQWISISKNPKCLECQALVPSCSFASSFQALLVLPLQSLHLPHGGGQGCGCGTWQMEKLCPVISRH